MRWKCAIGAVLGVAFVWYMGDAIREGRSAARRSQCISNLKWLIVSMHYYHDAHGSFPPGTVPQPSLAPEDRLSWVVLAGPGQLNQNDIRRDGNAAWHQPPNWPPESIPSPNLAQETRPPNFHLGWATCPEDERADRDRADPLPLCYVGIAGLGSDAATLPALHPRTGVFGYDRATKLADITDGASQTMMFLETARDVRPWTAGGSSSVRPVDPATRPYLGPNRPFGGYHRDGANLAHADGSVRFIRNMIDPKVLEALSTIRGGEPVREGLDLH